MLAEGQASAYAGVVADLRLVHDAARQSARTAIASQAAATTEPADTAADASSAEPWSALRHAAATLAAREPSLRPLLVEALLAPPDSAGIVAMVVARALQLQRVDAGLRDLISETLADDAGALLPLAADDLHALCRIDPACRGPLPALLHAKGLHALLAHRVAHRLWQRGRADAALWLAGRVAAVLGIDLHPAVPVGRGVVLDHATGLVVGETAVIEDDVLILHAVTLGATGSVRGDRHPKVRRGALLGAGALVLGNVEVGCFARVGAGSVVVRDVPAHCTVAGVPARVVRRRASGARVGAVTPEATR